ncbi:MAG TPA: sigma-70 family RNA polymerase sigma factor [Gemmataceae bacterium]
MGGGEWEQVLLGRLAWVRGVIARHVPQRESAEDLVQEVLAAAIARPPGSANGPRAECIDRWLRGLALNQVRMFRRSQGRRRRREEAAAAGRCEAGPPEDESPLALILRAERDGLLRAALARLPPADVRLMRWKYIDDWSYDRIARQLGVSRNVVAHRLREARDRLRAELRRSMPTEESP